MSQFYQVHVVCGGEPVRVLVEGRLESTFITQLDGVLCTERKYSERNAVLLYDEPHYEVRHVEINHHV